MSDKLKGPFGVTRETLSFEMQCAVLNLPIDAASEKFVIEANELVAKHGMTFMQAFESVLGGEMFSPAEED